LLYKINKLLLFTLNIIFSLSRINIIIEVVLIYSARVLSLDYISSNSLFEIAPLM
jgi:hypothetical protein